METCFALKMEPYGLPRVHGSPRTKDSCVKEGILPEVMALEEYLDRQMVSGRKSLWIELIPKKIERTFSNLFFDLNSN